MALLLEELIGKYPVYLCSPGIWRTATLTAIMRGMPLLRLPQSMGGYRLATQDDLQLLQLKYQMWLLANTEEEQQLMIPPKIQQRWETHPVIQNLKFFYHLTTEAILKLMAYIVDPRWFNISNRPLSYLQAYWGLTPRRKRDRWLLPQFRLLQSCWYDQNALSLLRFCDLGPDYLYDNPRYYLYAVWLQAYERNQRRSTTYADIKTGRKLINILYHLWIQTLYPQDQEIAFLPEKILPSYVSEEFVLWPSKCT